MSIRFIRDWLELPSSACVAEVMILPKNQGGFGINSLKLLSQKMRLIKRHALWQSPDLEQRSIASYSALALELQSIASDSALALELRSIASNSALVNCAIEVHIAASKDVCSAKKALKNELIEKASEFTTRFKFRMSRSRSCIESNY